MNEDGTHQDNENRISPVAEHGGLLLDSETGSEMLGKSTDKSLESAAPGDLVHGRKSKISAEMHSDLFGRSAYGLWMSSSAPVVGNADWRDQGLSRESLVYWPPLFPVSSMPGVVAPSKNVAPFERPQNSGTEASTISRSSNVEITVSSDINTAKKELVRFLPSREQEQFNLWKMASLIHNIAPSEKCKKTGSDDNDEMLYRARSLMDDEKTGERSCNASSGQSELQTKTKLAHGGPLYPILVSKAGNGDFDLPQKSLLGEKTVESQGSDYMRVIRNTRAEWPEDDRPSFVMSRKPSEQLAANSSTDICARMKLNHSQGCSQSSEASENHRQAKTGDSEWSKLPHYDAAKVPASVSNADRPVGGTGDVQILVGSSRPLLHEDIARKDVGALPPESALSELSRVKGPQDKALASSLPISESGGSLYRRRVKSLLLKRGNSLTEGTEAELPKSPRIQKHFASVFEHEESCHSDAMPDNRCGNFHEEKCDCEVNSGTDVALCHSPKDSEYKSKDVSGTGCHAKSPVEREILNSEKLPGMSCGVVNYATVSSETGSQDYRLVVSTMDCGYAGQQTKDGDRPTCIEKGLHVNAVSLCHHGAVSHSACQCCGDVTACHRSPSCHLPVKVSAAGLCDAATTKCSIAHRLGALPTPTRACAAALCQLSSSSVSAHASSPKCVETLSGCPFGHPGHQCTTPCHQAVVKCACIGDSHLPHQPTCPVHGMKRSLSWACPARIFHQDCQQQQQPANSYARPHTPCMAHTPYTPRETVTPREPDTPQAVDGVGEPCTPQSVCSRRAPRKYPCTPTTACYFQFPPLHAVQLDCAGGAVCQTPTCLSYARRLPACHTPCMSPLNLTIGQPCITHCRTPQCHFPHQKLTCADHHRHSCVCTL